MGGIPTDIYGRVRLGVEGFVDGLFSAGETACVSVHGANRLGSNSLLECVVYGRRVGNAMAHYLSDSEGADLPGDRLNPSPLSDRAATDYLQAIEKRLNRLLTQTGTDRVAQVRQSLQDCMTEHCGVFRHADLMEEGIQQLQNLRQRLTQIQLDDKGRFWNVDLIQALELENLFTVGEIIINSALHRQESRGAHFREDFPQRDDQQFLKHTLAVHTPEGVEIQQRSVNLSLFEPQERKY